MDERGIPADVGRLRARGYRLTAQRRAESMWRCASSIVYRSPHHHDHVSYSARGAVPEIALCPGADLTRRAEQETAFQIEGHTFDYYGRCPRCRVAG
ncbi:MAG TPA: hypothetical protein VFL91_32865 [Thermomicrobiales bacterium]|nr:hypothetical protein [Thermomicrobiales bacterium]